MKELNEKIEQYLRLKTLFDENANDFKDGKLTYEELHTIQYLLIHEMEERRKEIVYICEKKIELFEAIREKFKSYKVEK